jgi:hypothetical protein
MGQRQHYWCSGQLRIWQDIFGNGYSGFHEPAVGRDSFNGASEGLRWSRAHILRMLGLVLQAADSRGISQGFQERV